MKPDRNSAANRVAILDMTIDSACQAIAPLWPLDRFIAVNPFHGWRETPFPEAATKLGRLCGASLFMPPSYYQEAVDRGLIQNCHLEAAASELGTTLSAEECRRELDSIPQDAKPRPMLSGVLDSQRDLLHEPAWEDVIVRQISRFCAAWFDESSSDWRLHKGAGLYADWRDAIRHEHGINLLMHDNDIIKRAEHLPDNHRDLIGDLQEELELNGDAALDLLQSALLRINGWASWCAYLRWQSRLYGNDNRIIEELLAIRLAWERLLDDGRRDPSSAWQRWQNAWTRPEPGNDRWHSLYVWQRALELGYQTALDKALCQSDSANEHNTAAVQMAFCIDVRSEVIRRAIETLALDIQTLGFAGFFGLPIAYQPFGTHMERPQLPGLFKPQYLVTEGTGDAQRDRTLAKKIKVRLSRRAQTDQFNKMPASAFTLVEALGLGYVLRMLTRTLTEPMLRSRTAIRTTPAGKLESRLGPLLSDALSEDKKADLLAGILKAMSLTDGFAPLVVLTGHGSKTTNNPHAAGLDCGACGGQSGEINVRLLARLLNDAGLRRALRDRNLDIPGETLFLPALHNTTTDEIRILDKEDIPDSHLDRVVQLERTLVKAGDLARKERAPSLGLGRLAGQPERLLRAMRKRTLDWSQTRPEWGLANNAAFIAAPRSRTRNIDLRGRVFLHDYDASRDPGGETLELIMTGPLIVATWINMQYYASTVDNKRFGSGNKVLHNVAGGNIGVFEGNGGDLRTGLPMQSLHDGRRWIHTPQRLSIYLEADARSIGKVLDKHSLVRDLVENDWVFLFRIDRETNAIERYYRGKWSITNCTTDLN